MTVSKEVDVIIVGYGGAGAVAAITAHDMGARVVVLEKSAQGGGNTRLAVSSFTGVIPGEAAKEHLRTLCSGTVEDEIIDDFVVRFGDRVVGTPKDSVLRALSLMTPWIIIMLMLTAAVYTLMRWRGQSETVDPYSSQPDMGSLDDDYLARLEQDLVE